jgi:uncharacterized protein (TIGR03435 family)
MRKSAQRYREISDDVMRWIGIESVGPVLRDRPVSPHLRHRTLIRFVCLAATLACVTRGAFAQIPDAFEVTSIKPRTGVRAASGASTPDRFVRTDVTLRDLIRVAFNVQEFQIEGGPGWVASSRFDVNARASTAPSGPDGMRALVRRLLDDRFKLRARVESREMAIYELIVARDGRPGEKLRRSAIDCEAIVTSGAATAEDLARCDLRFRPRMTQVSGGPPSIHSMTLMLQGVRLARLATLLQNEVERIVIDRTGLDGTFDVELEFAPQGRRPPGLPGPPSAAAGGPPSDGPPLGTGLQEQLGLKLESGRGPVAVVVIESAELPTPD